ncbi:MAG: multicopper oxidase domain-containing protein [Parvularculaceae bacterium]
MSRSSRIAAASLLSFILAAACARRGGDEIGASAVQSDLAADVAVVQPNDNRLTAGVFAENGVRLDLTAQPALWSPERDEGPQVKVYALSEAGKAPMIPAPFLRVEEGTEVSISVTNAIPPGEFIGLPPPNRRYDSDGSSTREELIVHGLSAPAGSDAILRVPFGETREVTFLAEKPGRYLYWAGATERSLHTRTGPDSPMSGMIVVDPKGADVDPDERFFVITMIDAYPDDAVPDPGEDVFELAINGLSWPHTERLVYPKGDLIRWQWMNGSGFEHPMHLHGFHFRTLSRNDGMGEVAPDEDEIQDVVTELMEPGSSFLMEWTPTRPGNWLMHCHILDHVVPTPERSAEERAHDHHDMTQHPLRSMAGLVMGIVISDDEVETEAPPMRHLKLVARQAEFGAGHTPVRGYALETDNLSAEGDFSTPGPPIVLTKGEMTRITVVNHIDQPTSVHWHGLELQSYYDGMPGWSGREGRVAPLIETDGGSFDAYIAPPRAGAFIYHTHMDETDQLRSGMYGALIVMEPGETFDPSTDKVFVLGDIVDPEDGDFLGLALNGEEKPEPIVMKAGETYRLRFIDIGESMTLDISLSENGAPLIWRRRAKDGADLPDALQTDAEAAFRMGSGETYEFIWTPERAMTVDLVIEWPYPTFEGKKVVRRTFVVE